MSDRIRAMAFKQRRHLGGKSHKQKTKEFKMIIDRFENFETIIVVNCFRVTAKMINELKMEFRSKKLDVEIMMSAHKRVSKVINWYTKGVEKTDRDGGLMTGLDKKPWLTKIQPYLKGRNGLIFTNENDYREIEKILNSHTIWAMYKQGDTNLEDMIITPMLMKTRLDAGKIDLFHKLNIPVNIVRAMIEFSKENYCLLKKGDIMSNDMHLLLHYLNLCGTPGFGREVKMRMIVISRVKNGNEEFLDEVCLAYQPSQLLDMFSNNCLNLIGLSVGAKIVNKLSIGTIMKDNFFTLMAIGYSSGHIFKEIDDIRNEVKNYRIWKIKEAEEAVVEEVAVEEPRDWSSVSAGNLFGSDSSD